MRAPEERRREVGEPLWIWSRVRVEVRDDLTGRGLEARVPGARESAVLCADQAVPVVLDYLSGRVGRAIVDDDHLVVRILERLQALQAARKRLGTVVGAHDHRDPRPGEALGEGKLRERPRNGSEGELRLSL